jgi:hypothetical protein
MSQATTAIFTEEVRSEPLRRRMPTSKQGWTRGLTWMCIALLFLGIFGCVLVYFEYHGFQAIGKAARRAGLSGQVAAETMKFELVFVFLIFLKGAVALSMLFSVILLLGRFRNAHRCVMMVLMGAILYNVLGTGIAQIVQYSLVSSTPGGLPRVLSAQASARGRNLSTRQQRMIQALSKNLGSSFHGAIVMVALGATMIKCVFYVSLILFLTSAVVEEIYGDVSSALCA